MKSVIALSILVAQAAPFPWNPPITPIMLFPSRKNRVSTLYYEVMPEKRNHVDSDVWPSRCPSSYPRNSLQQRNFEGEELQFERVGKRHNGGGPDGGDIGAETDPEVIRDADKDVDGHTDTNNVGKRLDEEGVDEEVENPEGGEQKRLTLTMMAP
ncbi:MAG: hypothetical protein J3Q66DRAFT_367904 [Benniella sp.]|nr:MAG: hypothetical protein J3Q66DRAFT_367904 [Benniella sp.]